jgi:hypothetical protein
METYLTDSQQTLLRQSGVITQNEVAKRVGDLFVAEDVTNGNRRVIEKPSILSEVTGRQVLKG